MSDYNIEFKIINGNISYYFDNPKSEIISIKFQNGTVIYMDENDKVSSKNKIDDTNKNNGDTLGENLDNAPQTPKTKPTVSISPKKYKNEKEINNKEARKGITPILFETESNVYNKRIAESFRTSSFVDGQFDKNFIPDWRVSSNNQVSTANPNWVEKTLVENKIANKILDLVLNDGKGNWTMDNLIERARYNLTDLEVESLKATMGGVNAGVKKSPEIEKILNQFYIVVFKYNDVMDINSYYDLIDEQNRRAAARNGGTFTPQIRNKKGFYANRITEFYKIEMDEPTLAVFYTKLFNNINARDSMVYKLKLVKEYNNEIFATQTYPLGPLSVAKTDIDFFNELASGNLLQFENSFKSFFEVKSDIFSSKPLLIKIGKKEGLKIDQRYFVYEQQVEGDEIIEKRVGVIRATRKISDNRYNATGKSEPSLFYKVGGKVPFDKGMVVKKKPDAGFSIYIGIGLPNKNFQNFLFVKVSKNISRILNISQLRIEMGYWYSMATAFDKNYPKPGFTFDVQTGEKHETVSNDLTIQEIGIGIRKDIYIASYFQISPYLGYQLGLINYNDSNVNSSAVYNLGITTKDPYHQKMDYSGLALGTDFGLNLTHNFKLILSFNYLANRHFDINSKIKYYNSNRQFVGYGSSEKPYFNKFDAKLLTNFGFRLDF